jgi:hypothetical protein
MTDIWNSKKPSDAFVIEVPTNPINPEREPSMPKVVLAALAGTGIPMNAKLCCRQSPAPVVSDHLTL